MHLPSFRDPLEYYHRIPTTDLYFRTPVTALARREPELPPLRYLAPNVYAIGRTGIISRYASLDDLRQLQRSGARRLVYLADDDFEAGANDPSLPGNYRRRLAAFVEGAWRRLRAEADRVLVPSAALAAVYGEKARVLDPVWHRAPASTRHFAKLRQIEIVHLGSGSHQADLAPIAREIARTLAAHPHVRLTVFSGTRLPERLKEHPRVRSYRPMKWWLYRLWLPRKRFHLALYPLQQSQFNGARSANKLFEHAIVGAASLMSPNQALRDAAGAELADIFVKGDAEEWRARIEGDIADIASCRRRAERARTRIDAADPLSHAVSAWLDILAAET